jgi:hypothetical protein
VRAEAREAVAVESLKTFDFRWEGFRGSGDGFSFHGKHLLSAFVFHFVNTAKASKANKKNDLIATNNFSGRKSLSVLGLVVAHCSVDWDWPLGMEAD